MENEKPSFQYWKKKNESVLEMLYKDLIDKARHMGMKIYDDDESYQNFVKMMYDESNGEIVNTWMSLIKENKMMWKDIFLTRK